MTRRHLLRLGALAPAASLRAIAQSAFPGVAYRDYSRCLPDYLRELAAAAYERRNRAIGALTSAKAIRGRQQWVRDTFWKLAGGLPERTPLNARTLGSFERAGYRVEKVVYESRPRLHVPANLYIPTRGKPPYPGVLFQMGHSLNGKAAEPYQRCCQALARLGYVVLAFDPMGQGERVYYPDASGTRTRLRSADDEHTLPGKQMLLFGDTSTRLQAWDAVRSLDYLSAHPLVDPKRLASTGQSGGGTLTMFLVAVDDRLAAAAVSSGNTENFACAGFDPPGSTDDAEQNFVGAGPLGFDRWDLLYPFAPKPLLISVSDKDFFGTYSPKYIASGWEEFKKLRAVYDRMGHGDRLAWADTPLPHALAYDTRLQIYNWFERWLKGSNRHVDEEPETAPEADATLWVTESGSVVRVFGGETPFTLNRSRAMERRQADLEKLLALERAAQAPFTVLRRVPARGIEIEAVELGAAPRVWLPAWLYLPKRREANGPAVLVIEPAGRNARWREGDLCPALAERGLAVCAADVRGIGDLAPEFARGAPRYTRSHNDDEHYAWASVMLGKPLLGQRVADILALAQALRAHPPLAGRRVAIAARGSMTVPALLAAVLDTQIASLYLAGALLSWRSLVDSENLNHPFTNFLPGVLNHLDLPDAAARISPRRLVLAGAVNGEGKPADPAEVRRLYPAAVVLPSADWDVETIAAQIRSIR